MNEKIFDITSIINSLEKTSIRDMGLKGIVLIANFYDFGICSSSNIDLLVLKDYLEKFDTLIGRFRFIQSNPHEKNLCEVSKKEKMIQRLNHHNLIPYMKATKNAYQILMLISCLIQIKK